MSDHNVEAEDHPEDCQVCHPITEKGNDPFIVGALEVDRNEVRPGFHEAGKAVLASDIALPKTSWDEQQELASV